MSKAICPGQDTRYWKAGDIFYIPCNECGKMIEFFKDDVSRKCPNCGNRIQNPKISLGCAQWCQHAKKCLGYDPTELGIDINKDENELSICGDMINLITLRFGPGSDILKNAEIALEKAMEILKNETADPKIVTTSVLLYEVDFERSSKSDIKLKDEKNDDTLPIAKSIMREVDIDNSTIDLIVEIINACHKGDKIDSPEFRVVSEACNFIKEQY